MVENKLEEVEVVEVVEVTEPKKESPKKQKCKVCGGAKKFTVKEKKRSYFHTIEETEVVKTCTECGD